LHYLEHCKLAWELLKRSIFSFIDP